MQVGTVLRAQGTANYTNAIGDSSDHESFKTENLSRSDCEFSSKLVIVETVNSEDKYDESFQNESAGENNKILTLDNNNGVPVGLVKSEPHQVCNPALSIKLSLGRYEIAKVSKPQINLRTPSLVSQIHKVENNHAHFVNVAKPRSTPAREAVDPAKYYILNDEPDGTKYACSKCGNVYKWRKSLNKHWKEKHDGEAPPSLAERERMLKCPPQNFPKHSTLHVTSGVNNVGPKSILFPSSAVSLASFKSTNQIRIPTSVYTLVNVNKTAEASLSRSRSNQSSTSHSPNTIWKPQMLQSSDLIAVSPAHQAACKYKSSTKHFYDNYGVLDLSVKGASDQEKPIDFSTKSATKNDDQSIPNDLRKKVDGPNSENQDFTCFQCHLKFNQPIDLNSHFACQHMNILYETADDNIYTLDSRDHLSGCLIQSPVNNGPESIQCVICGFTERWDWQMFKHFESEHFGIEPNPYKTSRITYSDARMDASPSSPQSPVEYTGAMGLNSHLLNAEMLKKFGFPDNSVLDFESQGTAIVIPKAPEETALHARSGPHKIKSQETVLTDDGTAFLLPEATEESFSNSETVRVTYAGKSGRGKKENSLYNGDIVLPYECKLCGYRARWPSEMTQHMKNHSDEKPYQCPQCSYRSKWKWDVVKHLKRCGGNKEQGESSQKRKRTFPKAFPEMSSSDSNNDGTSSSKTSSSDSSQNQREVISKGPSNVTLQPNDKPKKRCFEEGSSPQGDRTDFEAMSNSVSNASSDHHSNLHPCDQCYFVGHSPAELKRHLRVHSDEKPYSCNTCSYSSKWKCDLKKHLRTYNHLPAVPMDQGKKFPSGRDAFDRAAVNPEEKMILDGEVFFEGRLKCKGCSYEATNMIALVEHVAKHNTNDSPIENHASGDNEEFSENSNINSENIKLQLMFSLGLHQISSSTYCPGNAENTEQNQLHRLSDHSTENKVKRESQAIDYTIEQSRNNGDHLEEEEEMVPSFDENQILDCRRQNCFNNSKSEKGSSSDSKVSPKLFRLQELTINNTRLKLIIKSDKHFYGCVKCPYVSLSSFRAVYHSRQHGSRKNFKCSFCDYSNNQLTFVRKHTASLHGEENNNNFRKSSGSATKKVDHFRIIDRTNANLRNNVCINCGYISLNGAAVVKHRLTRPCSQLLIKHPLHQHMGDVFSCGKCSFKTDERLAMVNHSKGHGSLLEYKCLNCDFSSSLMNVIRAHEKHQHGSAG